MTGQNDWGHVIECLKKSQKRSIMAEVASDAVITDCHETVGCFKEASINLEEARENLKELRKDQNCEKCPLDNLED